MNKTFYSILFLLYSATTLAQTSTKQYSIIGHWKMESHSYIHPISKKRVEAPLAELKYTEQYYFKSNGTYLYEQPACAFPNDSIQGIVRYDRKMKGIYALKKGVSLDTIIFQQQEFWSSKNNRWVADKWPFRIAFRIVENNKMLFRQAATAEILGTTILIKVE